MNRGRPPGAPAAAGGAGDRAAARLAGGKLPGPAFDATGGGRIDLRELAAGTLVFYVYPRTGQPGAADLPGWDEIPGARGCTAQARAFRDLSPRFGAAGSRVAGLSAQTASDQPEATGRLCLSFPLLADPGLRLAAALGLPTFGAGGMRLYRRLTLVARAGTIVRVFHVSRPERNADDVLAWLKRAA